MRNADRHTDARSGAELHRRRLLRLLGGCFAASGFGLRAFAPDEPLEIDRLWDRVSSEKITERIYRVDATVLLLSVPVLRRIGVGDARVALRQAESAGNGSVNRLALEFTACSDPARAHGLDRMGWIREVVVEKDGAPERAGVLGIMSDSPEQTAEDARSALHNDAGGERLVAIDCCHAIRSDSRTRSRVIRFRAPRGNWTGGEGLPELARESFRTSRAVWKDTQWPVAGTAPQTFLYALKRAMETGRAGVTEYIWNQSRFVMRIGREPDTAATREFDTSVDRIHGELQNVTQNLRPVRFQIWIDRDAPIPMPLRVEFQPRAFLRLTLEAIRPTLESQLKERR